MAEAAAPIGSFHRTNSQLLRGGDEEAQRNGFTRLLGEIQKESGHRGRKGLQHALEATGSQLLKHHRLEGVREAEPLFGERGAHQAVAAHDPATHRNAPGAASALQLPCIERAGRLRTDVGVRNASGGAREERHLQLLFQLTDGLAQRRTRNAERATNGIVNVLLNGPSRRGRLLPRAREAHLLLGRSKWKSNEAARNLPKRALLSISQAWCASTRFFSRCPLDALRERT
jgi:hypothetical protein